MLTKLWPSTFENTEERSVPSSLKISFTTSHERTLPLYRPATFEMWFWMTDVSVALSLIAETQDGSCECQTAVRARERRGERATAQGPVTYRACGHGRACRSAWHS